MGSTSSTQRGGNVTQPQTVLRKSTNANTPNDVAQQAANITKDNADLIFPNIKQDTKKEHATPTEGPISAAVATMPSVTYSNTTSPATKFPDQAAKGPSPPVSRVANTELSKLTNAISSSETPQVLEVVASEDTKGAPNRALAPKQVDRRIDAQPGKRPRKVRGKGKSKTGAKAGRHDTENIPPPAARQIAPYRRRRAPGSGLNEIGARPARRGKATHGVGGAGALEAPEVANGANSRSAEADVKAMGRHPHIGVPRDHGLASARPMGRTTRRLPSKGDIRKKSESGLEIIAVENAEVPKVDNGAKTAADGHSDHRSIPAPLAPPIDEDAAASSPCETGFPEPSAEGDASIVQPLPSSTRRRAKEYFQRRTRERSVDAAGRHIRRPRRSATVTEQGIQSNVQVPRSQQDIKEGAAGKASEKLAGRSADAKPDHFEFDPEASPFTPNATSSPRQASFSSIGVQSLSSPTPLPSHGNRKVAPLILPKTSNRSTQLETRGDSLAQLIPITSHVIQGAHGLAYTYAEANQAQAHLQVQQIALMRLQAYYSWLAGSIPTTGVGIGVSAYEHMDMSGGAGGLSGGVALGRHSQSHGHGKGQCRNSSGAYAHPKEHVVFSPRDHEQAEVASQSVLQRDGGQKGPCESGKGEAEKVPEGEARKAVQKWDGKWGLRETAACGKDVGWSWGRRELREAGAAVGAGVGSPTE